MYLKSDKLALLAPPDLNSYRGPLTKRDMVLENSCIPNKKNIAPKICNNNDKDQACRLTFAQVQNSFSN